MITDCRSKADSTPGREHGSLQVGEIPSWIHARLLIASFLGQPRCLVVEAAIRPKIPFSG